MQLLRMGSMVVEALGAVLLAGCAAGTPASNAPHVVAVEPPAPLVDAPPAVVVAVPVEAPRALEVPAVRTGGNVLVVGNPPMTDPDRGYHRLRNHVKGALRAGDRRDWVGPPVPLYVELVRGTLELFLLDVVPEGHLALYRDPYGASSCALSSDRNCANLVQLYDRSGEVVWSLDIAQLVSRPDHLELQDVRLAGGVLYFNEACQSYSREAGGACSALVAVDPRTGREQWRTRPLTSNNVFLVLERYIVAGYGFTAEPDFLHVVDRATGRVVQRIRLRSAHSSIVVDGQSGVDRLVVTDHDGRTLTYLMEGFDGPAPRLVPVD